MRKFKLLKDLPNLKAGTIFEETVADHYTTITGDKWGDGDNLYYGSQTIKNNPEWFSEIFEPKPQEIIEGCLTGIYNKVSSMYNGERDSILIINPTPQTRELLKGKVEERWVTDEVLGHINRGYILERRRSSLYCNKILIAIPEEKT